MLALVAWGVWSLMRLPLDAVPDITNNQVQVITQAPSLAAQEVEQFITFPLENALRNMPGVEEIRSISRFGLSVITVVFTDDVDTYRARQLTSEQLKIAEADMLQGVGTPAMAPITTGLGEIYQYILKPASGYEDRYSAMELRSIQDWIVKRQLSGIAGVVEVSSFGGFVKEYEVSIAPERLNAMNLSLHDVLHALELNNANTGGSYIEKGNNAFFIRGEGMVNSLRDIEQIVITNRQGVPVLVQHVAQVRFGHSVRYGAMTRNGQGEVVGGIVMMLKGASSEATIQAVKERVALVQGSLPEGLVLEAYLDRTTLIDKTIRTVRNNLIEGGLIVVFVLVLLLGNVRAGMVVASVIPLSMLFALGMMNTFGVSANLMSLGAIDFGLIVDGAVIIVESIVHRLHTHYGNQRISQQTLDQSIYESSTRIRKSAAFGEIIILIVYLPILALSGIEGKMFHPMAQTVSFAILGALILSLTYVPVASALFLKRTIVTKATVSDRIVNTLYRGYYPVLKKALRQRAAVLLSAVALFAGSIWLLSGMGGEFIPSLDEGDMAVSIALKPGSSLSQTIRTTTQIEQILLKQFPEVREVISKIGTAEIPTDPMAIETGDIMIILKERDEWVSASSREELMEKMEAALSVLPGVNMEFTQPIQLRFNELMTGVKSDIAIKLYGEDLDLLYKKANQSAMHLRKLDGVADLRVEQIVGLPQVLVAYNRERIAQYGVNITHVNEALKMAFAGQAAGVVLEGDRRFDLVVRLDTAHRKDIADVRNLFIDIPVASNGSSGQARIPLSELARIEYKEAPMQISRENARRRITIGVNVRQRDVESVVHDIRQTLQEKVSLPPGYYFTFGGQFENLENAKRRLSIAVPAALLLIVVLLYFTFNSMVQALLIFTAVPLSAIGGIVALWLRDMPFSISAGIGFIALFGVAVLNGIVLIGYFNQLKAEGETNPTERVLQGTRVRFRPVLMTAVVASLGFLPMALSNSAGAEVQKPLATVVIGGLVSATLLTLVVLPVLYILSDGWEKRFTTKGHRLSSVAVGLITGFIGILIFSSSARGQQAQVTSAQRAVNLEQAIQLALQQNGTIQLAHLEVAAQQRGRIAAWDVPKTALEVQYGQINALTYDYSYNLVQQVHFPTFYTAQEKLYRGTTLSAVHRQALREKEVIRNVKQVYYTLLYLHKQAELLQRQDSLYQRAARAAEVRRRTGEAPLLEQVTAETRARDLQNRLFNARANISIQQYQLALLLQQEQAIQIDTSLAFKIVLPELTGITMHEQHPLLFILRQEHENSRLQTRVEINRMLPDLRFGFYTQSIENIRGFNVYQAGIAVPLVYTGHKGRIAALRVQEQIAHKQLALQSMQLSNETSRTRQQLARLLRSIEYYEQYAIPQSQLIIRQAERSFRSGDIDYLSFFQNALQAWQIQEAYLDQLQEYNQAVIQLEFLTSSK